MTIIQASKAAMKSVAYAIIVGFESDMAPGWESNVIGLLEDIGEWEEYHNFWKLRLPYDLYAIQSDLLGCEEDDMVVEVARIKGNHAKDLHYHKISHAICVVLGPSTGFPDPKGGKVVIDGVETDAYEGLECYFPSGCEHTFHGGEENDLYFLSIQSPPLLTEENDDFYWVNEERR